MPSQIVSIRFLTLSALTWRLFLSKYKLVTNVHSTKEQEIDYRADYITGGVCCCRRWILLQPCYHATDHATDQKYKYTYKYKFAKQIQKTNYILGWSLQPCYHATDQDLKWLQWWICETKEHILLYLTMQLCREYIFVQSAQFQGLLLNYLKNSFFILCHPSQPIAFHKLHISCLFHFVWYQDRCLQKWFNHRLRFWSISAKINSYLCLLRLSYFYHCLSAKLICINVCKNWLNRRDSI